ncbi:hypothetical protein OEZ85_003134 [Tetradesmus obliquus]|uniref:Nucleotide-diphospho-sugar transferase domain-containing protein n=1 Tax=Tetradesmus obliquus TaxID=3088 RepID=A0ABY8U0K0_TETOB|nr:hypothetical protein OEZ85_003134 [Tetradesmus obliquus]
MNRVAVVSLAVFWIALHATAVAGAAAAGAATAAEAAAAAEQEAKGWFTGAAAHKRDKRVIVIVGTAGSGTRNIHSLLAAAGVWMHPDTNKEFDSNVFIKRVKETPAFGLPGSQSGLIWETRASPADYRLDSLSADVYSELLQGHIQAAEELLASVPDDVAVWGWKEPQAIYTLPFLYRVFPNLHVIHEVRDGRDVALSNLNSTNLRTTRKFQRYYIQTFAGREYSDWQLTTHHFSKAAAGAWAQVNLNAKKWATEAGWGVKGQYSITRLEDFCDPASIHAAIRTMFSNAGVPFNQASVRRAAAAIDPRKCETDRWKAAWDADDEVLAAAIRNIDASIGGALEAFNYRSQSPLEMQNWLAAPAVMTGLREVALYTARAIPEWDGSIPPARPIILTEVSNGYEAVLENWLNWLQAGGVDLTRVLVVTKGSSAASVKAIVDGMGPSVYEMPPLETPEITIMNKNDDPVLNTLWVERMRMLYEIVGAGVPVVMSDLDAIWFRDALADIEAKAAAQPGGFDMALSQGMWPPETYRVFRTSGCLGLAFFNATAGSRAVLRHMLAHAQRNMHLMFDDQQALNHQLVMANLLVNSTTPAPSGLQDSVVIGSQITTAPDPLRVLFLPHVQYQRFCDDATMKNAVVGHCRIRDVQNFKTPQMKQQLMKSMGLWKKETRDWLLPSPSPEPIVRSPDFWLPPPWIGTPPPLNPLACTPQLLIIAAPKAGTTAVYDYLNGTIAGFTVHSEAVHFLNGSEASKQYMTEFRKLPEEKRRFHPRLAGSFLKEMHIFDSNISLIPERLKQFPGITAATDDPLAGICSFEAAAFGLPQQPAASAELSDAADSSSSSSSTSSGGDGAAANEQQGAELLPQARYLVLLREPVSRVISHFNMRIQGQALLDEVAPGNYSSGWADYIASEVERQMSTLNKCSARISRHSPVPAYTQLANCLFGLPVSRDINEYDLYKGLYDLHLQRWFDHFEPEQTLIWSSRAFSLAPKQHLEQLVSWLGLDLAEINRRIDFVKIHERSYPDDQPMPAWLFEQLVQFYEPHKQATLQLLQKVGYLQLAEQLGAAWEEELAYTQQKLVRQAAATRR